MAVLQNFFTNFHLGAASGWDLFIGLAFLTAVLVYGFFLGRNRLIILLLSSYFALLISRVIPWGKLATWEWLGVQKGPSASTQIIVFLALVLFFYFLIPRSVLSSVLRIRKRGEAAWWQLFILSIMQVGLLVAVIFSFLNPAELADLAPLIKKLFINPNAEFVWITLPILTMTLMRRKKKKEK